MLIDTEKRKKQTEGVDVTEMAVQVERLENQLGDEKEKLKASQDKVNALNREKQELMRQLKTL